MRILYLNRRFHASIKNYKANDIGYERISPEFNAAFYRGSIKIQICIKIRSLIIIDQVHIPPFQFFCIPSTCIPIPLAFVQSRSVGWLRVSLQCIWLYSWRYLRYKLMQHSHADDISDRTVRWCLFHVAWNRQRVTSSVMAIFLWLCYRWKLPVTNYNRSFLTISIVVADMSHIQRVMDSLKFEHRIHSVLGNVGQRSTPSFNSFYRLQWSMLGTLLWQYGETHRSKNYIEEDKIHGTSIKFLVFQFICDRQNCPMLCNSQFFVIFRWYSSSRRLTFTFTRMHVLSMTIVEQSSIEENYLISLD